MQLLPDKLADLTINISSLHEMREKQIHFYFKEIDRLTNKIFYLKQWKKTIIPMDNQELKEENYPFFPNWKLLHRQECAIQKMFFERIYKIG